MPKGIKHPQWMVDAARELYEAYGLTQTEIAEKLEVGQQLVSSWVRYKTR